MFDEKKHSSSKFVKQQLPFGDPRHPLVLEYNDFVRKWLPVPVLKSVLTKTRHLTDSDVHELELMKFANMRSMAMRLTKDVQIKLCHGLTDLLYLPDNQSNSFLKNQGYPYNQPGLFQKCSLRKATETDHEVILIE